MRELRRGLRRERNLMVYFSIILIGGGNWFGWHMFKKENVLAIFGWAVMVVGLRLAWSIWRQPKIDENQLFYILEKQPEKITWVYSLNTRSMPFGFHLWDTGTIYFKLSDGNEITLSLPTGKLKMVSKFLNRILPHATFGYSEEKKRRYEDDPTSLNK